MPNVIERETSGFPVSIGTGLAIEHIFKPTEESLSEETIEQDPNLLDYNVYAFNVSTLVRNLISSVPTDRALTIKPVHYLETLKEEVLFLNELYRSSGLSPVFYINSYSFFKRNYKDRLRVAKTERQIVHETIVNYCLSNLGKEVESQGVNLVKLNKDLEVGDKVKVLLLSHLPVDLLSYSKYSQLDLLESHTGEVKTRRTWNTKYYKIPNKDMSFLPFLEYLLFIFGDTSMIKPAPLKERLSLYEALLAKKVNPLTSEFAMLININK